MTGKARRGEEGGEGGAEDAGYTRSAVLRMLVHKTAGYSPVPGPHAVRSTLLIWVNPRTTPLIRTLTVDNSVTVNRFRREAWDVDELLSKPSIMSNKETIKL